MFVTPENMGWGNVSMCLTDYVCYNHSNVNVYKPTFTEAVRFKIPVKWEDTIHEPLYTPRIVINNYFIEQIHSKMSDIFEPSPNLQELIDTYKHLVDGVVAGMHIRRGAFSEDSSKMGCHGVGKPAYFANDKALQDFKNILKNQSGKFFVASDSPSVKKELVEEFGDKVSILDFQPVLSYDCTFNHDTPDGDKRISYLEWFLLSMCPFLIITGGNNDMTDFSTFGYSAACYGRKPFYLIKNE
jgi:hypothetical protein